MEDTPFLLQYHLSRRQDEGWGMMALVFAKDVEEAEKKLILSKTYQYSDAISSETVKPDAIKCLNIY